MINISLLQVLALLFTLFAMSRTILRAKDKKLSLGELLFFSGIWFVLLFVAFFPGAVTYVADIVGIGRGIDVIVYASIGVLFYLIFRMYVKLEETEMQITKLVREIAISKRRKK